MKCNNIVLTLPWGDEARLSPLVL